MGCRVTKAEVVVAAAGDPSSSSNKGRFEASEEMSSDGRLAERHKARLERQMCLARETPEPEFVLSECDLKEVPSGVFILCRVLRKERLDLQRNRLRSLSGGGALGDLALLTVLDLRGNRFKSLPDELDQLTNLKELFVSHNQLERLPRTVNKLRHLELLDIAHNRLRNITEINCMAHLQTLDISHNAELAELPMELSTCAALLQIICTATTIAEPPRSVMDRGTQAILTYLAGDVMTALEFDEHIDNQDQSQYGRSHHSNRNEELMRKTKEAYSADVVEKQSKEDPTAFDLAEQKMQLAQQQRHEQLLKNLLQQQTESDQLISKLQSNRDTERYKLIDEIVKAEASSSDAVEKLLSIRTEPDAFLLEREHHEQQVILEQLRIQHSELRKTEVLAAMSNSLAGELHHIDAYQRQRDTTTRDILQAESDAHRRLDRAVWDKDRVRADIFDRIVHDEQLQRTAVGSLIEHNDARSWALIEQVRLVEVQLQNITRLELDRKQHSVDTQLTELGEMRINLTCTLLELMAQQEKRKQQLLDTLHDMENQKRNEQDFWLLQYQKLIDSRPLDHSSIAEQLDPHLGYQLLVHGAIHCLPFLAKLLQPKLVELCDVNDDALRKSGVTAAADRGAILNAIFDYTQLVDGSRTAAVERAVEPGEEALPSEHVNEETSSTIVHPSDGVMQTECVVCMENSCKIIFLPCGHLCCCLDCHEALVNCPMCRADIDRRIKVIQV